MTSLEQAGNQESAAEVLVVRDSLSKTVFGHPVLKKSAEEKELAVDAALAYVKWLGCANIICKTGSKVAI